MEKLEEETVISVIKLSVVGGGGGGGDSGQCYKVCCWCRRCRRRLLSVL